MSSEPLVQAARVVGEALLEQCRRTPKGYATWLGPTGYGTDQNPLRVVQMGPTLYDGTGGVALFLAALARTTGDRPFRDLALQAITPLKEKVLDLAAAPERADRLNISVGGLMGSGSYIYALLRTGTLLDERSLVDAAHAATTLVTPERIRQDTRVRVQTGSAGAILALLALHSVRPERNGRGRTPLELATDCALHLLEGRVSLEGRPRAWPLSVGKPPLGGFCYGAAGICHALLRVDEQVPRPELREAAHEGLAFLDSLYSPEHGGWRDVRATVQARMQKPDGSTWKDFWFAGPGEESAAPMLELLREGARPGPLVDSFQRSWCHGNAGIALGRLASLRQVDDPEAREQIFRALAELSAPARADVPDLDPEDDLCCGNMGRADVLHQAGMVLGEERWLAAARELAGKVLQRAGAAGDCRVSAARGTEVFAPSFFQGVAGAGYAFLRLAFPGALPCVLLLE